MKLYVVINPGGYVDSDEVRGIFSSMELAEKCKQFGDQIYEAEMDVAYPHGIDPEYVRMKTAPREKRELSEAEKAIVKALHENPYVKLLQ